MSGLLVFRKFTNWDGAFGIGMPMPSNLLLDPFAGFMICKGLIINVVNYQTLRFKHHCDSGDSLRASFLIR